MESNQFNNVSAKDDIVDKAKVFDYKKTNIILIGIMGCGKTSIGKYLSYLLKKGFLDLDQIIENKLNMSIKDIFVYKGEEFFRSCEKQEIKHLYGIENHVISIGGGAILDDENVNYITKIGTVVWINTDLNCIVNYLYKNNHCIDSRPLISDLVLELDLQKRKQLLLERLQVLFLQRKDRYAIADIVCDVSQSLSSQVAMFLKNHIINYWETD